MKYEIHEQQLKSLVANFQAVQSSVNALLGTLDLIFQNMKKIEEEEIK